MENLDILKQKIYNDYLLNNDASLTARENKVSYNWVRHILASQGVKNTVKELTEQEKQTITNEYLNGKSSTKLAKELNRNTETICNFLRKQEIIKKKRDNSFRKFTFTYDYFNTIDSEEKAYWLGFIYADGYVKDKYTFGIGLAIKDLEHLEKFKNSICYTGNIRIVKNETACILDITKQETVADLINKGVFKAKTFNVIFPTEKQLPEEYIHHFLRGYFDGDGYVSKDCKAVEIIGTENLAYGFSEHVFKNTGLQLSYIGTKNKFINGIVSFQYNGAKRIAKLYDYLYKDATIFLERKQKRFELNKYN